MCIVGQKSVHIVFPSLPESPLLEKWLTIKELIFFLQRCFEELEPQLTIAKSFDDVMVIVQKKCTVINVACLETVIDFYNIEKPKFISQLTDLQLINSVRMSNLVFARTKTL